MISRHHFNCRLRDVGGTVACESALRSAGSFRRGFESRYRRFDPTDGLKASDHLATRQLFLEQSVNQRGLTQALGTGTPGAHALLAWNSVSQSVTVRRALSSQPSDMLTCCRLPDAGGNLPLVACQNVGLIRVTVHWQTCVNEGAGEGQGAGKK
ncbi:hypothetical protein PoB_000165200 [Plakobranchus ocellatus]|uniref:Uncharacterized protein n=1 Tax=Plakobranchus ocellatus TaxID=259542 RepID=A0AAV3XYE5_9GAST|nr:hypothetical protein PoB_000165200 [Plakobranchus ocellatus]